MAKRHNWAYVQEALASGVSFTKLAVRLHIHRTSLLRRAKRLRWATPDWVKQSLDSLMALQTSQGVPVWEDGGALGASVRHALQQASMVCDLLPDHAVDGLLAGDQQAFAFRTNREIALREQKKKEASEFHTFEPQDLTPKRARPKTVLLDPNTSQAHKTCSIVNIGDEAVTTEVTVIERNQIAQVGGPGVQRSESQGLVEADIYSMDRSDLLAEIRKMMKRVKAEQVPLKEVGHLRNLVALHKELSGRETESSSKGASVFINIGGLSGLGRQQT